MTNELKQEAPAIAAETITVIDEIKADVIKAPRDLAPPASHEPEVALVAVKAASSELHTLLHNVGNAAEMPVGELRRLAHRLYEALGAIL
jgi:hypothetical protein